MPFDFKDVIDVVLSKLTEMIKDKYVVVLALIVCLVLFLINQNWETGVILGGAILWLGYLHLSPKLQS